MIVTALTPLTKQKMEVEIDGQFAFVLYKGELSRFKLREQKVLDDTVYEQIVREVLSKRAKLRAMHLLEKRDYTEQGIRKKLQEGRYPESCIEQALSYVKSYHYVDDDRYARRYVEQYKERKSKKQIQLDLMRKGVDRNRIHAALEEHFADSERELIESLVQKKLQKKKNDESSDKEYQKIYSFLMRKGFASSEITSVLREYFTGKNIGDDW